MADDDTDLEPVEEDLRADDQEYQSGARAEEVQGLAQSAAGIEDAFEELEHALRQHRQAVCLLEWLSQMVRDKEFADVLGELRGVEAEHLRQAAGAGGGAKIQGRRPVYQAASEVMERCAVVAFDLTHINDLMLLVRDDVAMIGRGVAWCRYEERGRQLRL